MNQFNLLKLNNSNTDKHKYKKLFLSLLFSFIFLASFTIIIFSPIVDNSFPKGSEIRQLIYYVYVTSSIGCYLFIMYSITLYMKYKSRDIGILLTLGMTRTSIKKAISKELNKVIIISSILGSFLGGILSYGVNLFFRLFLIDSNYTNYKVDISAIIIMILVLFVLKITTNKSVKKFIKNNSILEFLNEQNTTETSKEVSIKYLIFGVILSVGGIFAGYVVPLIFSKFGRSLQGLWSLTYLLSIVGIYLLIVYIVMGKKSKRKKFKYYDNIISHNMMMFHGKQYVKSMCIVTIMLISTLFALLYVPQLQSALVVYQASEFDISIPTNASVDIINYEYITQTALENNIEINDYYEIEFSNLLGSGVERNWNDNNDLVEEYLKNYKYYEFINVEQYTNLTGKNLEIKSGEYILITSSEKNESFWEKHDDLDYIENIETNEGMNIKYSGVVIEPSLLMNGVNRYAISNEDYNKLTKNLTSEYKTIQTLFRIEGSKENKYNFSNSIYDHILENTPEKFAVLSSYDSYMEEVAKQNNQVYDYSDKLELTKENQNLSNYWKYYPLIKSIIVEEYLKHTLILTVIFLYGGLISFIAALGVADARVKTLAINNTKLFEDLKKMGATNNYVEKCFKAQAYKVYSIPILISGIIMFIFNVIILIGSDNKLSTSDIMILLVDTVIIFLIALLLYIAYTFRVKNIKNKELKFFSVTGMNADI